MMMMEKFEVPIGVVHRHIDFRITRCFKVSRVIIISGKKAALRESYWERLSRKVPRARQRVRETRVIISLHTLCSFPDSNTRRMLRDEVAGLTLSDGRDDGWILLRDGPHSCQPEAFAVTNLIFIADDENSPRINLTPQSVRNYE